MQVWKVKKKQNTQKKNHKKKTLEKEMLEHNFFNEAWTHLEPQSQERL